MASPSSVSSAWLPAGADPGDRPKPGRRGSDVMSGLFDWMKAGVVFGLSLGYPAGYWRGDNAG
ncbi:MAG TPA: hypothetical protein VFQ34_04755 [Nitrospiraceae bacterium]|nr:hypothetical protein [Nitrospiraceae bacterium]